MFSEDQLKWYDKVGKGRPTHISHGITSDNINDHMKQLKITNWHLRGNQLHGETEMRSIRTRNPYQRHIEWRRREWYAHIQAA